MTAQRTQHGTKRPVQSTRSAPELQSPQLRAQTPPANLASASQHSSAPGDWSAESSIEHEDCVNHEADETVCYSQNPLSQSQGEEAQSPAPVFRSAAAPSPEPAQSSANAPAVPVAWWISLQQEQLVAYTQQQQELFAQAGQVHKKLLDCSSQQEHEQLTLMMQNIAQREQELRYMLEARQAWDSYNRMFEQHLTKLASRGQSHP